MPATIKLMSWNMNNYGLKGFRKFDLGELIAKILQIYNIDICAMIEIKNNGYTQIANSIVAELDNLGYHQHNWKYTFVNVGDEGVLFFWHEEAPGANAFKGYGYTNNNNQAISKIAHRLTNNLTLLNRLIHPLSSNRNPMIGERRMPKPMSLPSRRELFGSIRQ